MLGVHGCCNLRLEAAGVHDGALHRLCVAELSFEFHGILTHRKRLGVHFYIKQGAPGGVGWIVLVLGYPAIPYRLSAIHPSVPTKYLEAAGFANVLSALT